MKKLNNNTINKVSKTQFFSKPSIKKLSKYILSFILGGSIIASLPPINFFVVAPVAIAILSYIFLNSNRLKESILLGFSAGCGFGWIGFYWFFYPIVYVTNSDLLGLLAVIVAALIMGVFFIGIAVSLYFVVTQNIWLIVLYNTAVWSSFEIIRGELLFGGIPWNIMATYWDSNLYMLQIASFVGMYGLSFLTYFLFSCLLLLFNNTVKYKNKMVCILIIFLILGIGHWVGYYRVSEYNKLPPTEQNVAILQPNVDQLDKINGTNDQLVLQQLLNTTAKLTLNRKDLLVIWPETALSSKVMTREDLLLSYMQKSLNNGATLIAGLLRTDNNLNLYNSALIFNPQYSYVDFYDKVHLVPFGEYIPGTKWFNMENTFISDFTFAEGIRDIAFKVGELTLFKVLICFEAIFSNKNLNSKNINFIVNISNDGWYGNSVQPYQHLSLVRFRAIEGGVPVLRSVNSGVSVIIDAVGDIKNRLSMFSTGFLIAKIPPPCFSASFYSFAGNTWVFLINGMLLISFISTLVIGFIRNEKNTT